MNNTEVEIEIAEERAMPFDMGNIGGNVGMIDLSDMMGKALGKKPTKRQKLRVPDAWDKLVDEEADKRLDDDDVAQTALQNAETNGIVFLDEIDKIAVSDVRGGSVSREGVQRDLLPLIEGTTVATKYGPMKTDHVLFIASGSFHVAKPSDMLPELQGRLPIRVELRARLIKHGYVQLGAQLDRATVRRLMPNKHLQKRCFARAIGTNNHSGTAGTDVEVNRSKPAFATEAGGRAADAERKYHYVMPSRSVRLSA